MVIFVSKQNKFESDLQIKLELKGYILLKMSNTWVRKFI